MAKSRLVGSYPVIGIRPTIDGRRGALDVRGSLEEQTMNMAKSAAKLFEENLRYSNGEPVKVVIADTTIGRVGESASFTTLPVRPRPCRWKGTFLQIQDLLQQRGISSVTHMQGPETVL